MPALPSEAAYGEVACRFDFGGLNLTTDLKANCLGECGCRALGTQDPPSEPRVGHPA
jgi:hypothetical protein